MEELGNYSNFLENIFCDDILFDTNLEEIQTDINIANFNSIFKPNLLNKNPINFNNNIDANINDKLNHHENELEYFKIDLQNNSFTIGKEINPSNLSKKENENNVQIGSNRLFHKDAVYKKFKTHLMRYVINTLNKFIRKEIKSGNFKDFKIKKIKIMKLPNLQFTSNVNISFNKNLMNLSIYEIFSTNWKDSNVISNKSTHGYFNNNLIILEWLSKHVINEDLHIFLSKKFSEVLSEYLSSKEYDKDLSNIKANICESHNCKNVNNECNGLCEAYIENFKEFILGKKSSTLKIGIINDFNLSKPNDKKIL